MAENPVTLRINTHNTVDGGAGVTTQMSMRLPKLLGSHATLPDGREPVRISRRYFPPRVLVEHASLGPEGIEVRLPTNMNGKPEVTISAAAKDRKVTIIFPNPNVAQT
jgi:hypothetical protein